MPAIAPPPAKKSERRDIRFANGTETSTPPPNHPGFGDDFRSRGLSAPAGSTGRAQRSRETLPKGRDPRSRVLAGSRRPEIRADGNAPYPLAGDEMKGRLGGRLDDRTLRQDRRAGGTKPYAAARRQCLRRISWVTPRTAARSARRSSEPWTVVLRHRHCERGCSLPGEPDAESNEQHERTEAGERALSHRSRINADGSPVQAEACRPTRMSQ